jgi:hypothetical protein
MISDYYINDYVTYAKSGSMTSDGTYVFTSSVDLSGSCRIEPITDNEGDSTHRIFMSVVSLDHVDTIYVDEISYEIKGINKYQSRTNGHHLELDVFVV